MKFFTENNIKLPIMKCVVLAKHNGFGLFLNASGSEMIPVE